MIQIFIMGIPIPGMMILYWNKAFPLWQSDQSIMVHTIGVIFIDILCVSW